MKCIKAFKKSLFYILFLQLLIEPYLEWAIAGIMNVKYMVSTNPSDRYSNFTGVVCFILAFIVVPGALLKIYYVPLKQFRKRSYKEPFGNVFYDIRTR